MRQRRVSRVCWWWDTVSLAGTPICDTKLTSRESSFFLQIYLQTGSQLLPMEISSMHVGLGRGGGVSVIRVDSKL